MPFRCVIVTPEQQVLDESLTHAILPAHDGLVGILTDRAPLLVKLGQGPLRVDLAGGQTQNFYVEGGGLADALLDVDLGLVELLALFLELRLLLGTDDLHGNDSRRPSRDGATAPSGAPRFAWRKPRPVKNKRTTARAARWSLESTGS